jgi:hypothetical protein
VWWAKNSINLLDVNKLLRPFNEILGFLILKIQAKNEHFNFATLNDK